MSGPHAGRGTDLGREWEMAERLYRDTMVERNLPEPDPEELADQVRAARAACPPEILLEALRPEPSPVPQESKEYDESYWRDNMGFIAQEIGKDFARRR